MTTLGRYQGMGEILASIDAVRFRHWALQLATGALAVLAVGMGAILVIALSMGYWQDQPPAMLRWGLVGAAAVAFVAAIAWYLVRTCMRRNNAAQTARLIEQALPDVHNDLINSLLLSRDRDQSSTELVQYAIREAARRSRRMDLFKSISLKSLRRWGIAAGVAVVLMVGFASLQPDAFARGLMGINPVKYLPTVNTLKLVSLTPGDTKIFAGESVTVTVKIENPAADPLEAVVFLDSASPPRIMVPDKGYSVFTCTLSAVDETFSYGVRVGGSRWPVDKPYYTVTVVKRVEIEGLDLRYNYPPYTALKAKSVTNAEGSIEAPMGTRVTATLRVSEPVNSAVLTIRGQSDMPMLALAGNTQFQVVIPVDKDGQYRLALRDESGNIIQQLPEVGGGTSAADTYSAAGRSRLQGYYRIRAVPDDPPRIEFVTPNRDVSVPVGGKLETRIKVYDKYGLSDATFYAGKEGRTLKPIHHYDFKGKKEGIFDYIYKLDKSAVEGDVIVYYATVTDNRKLAKAGPQTVAASRFKILVQDAAKVAAEKAKRYDELRRRLLAILAMQETQKVNALICHKNHPALVDEKASGVDVAAKIGKLRATGTEIFTVQGKIKAALLDLADNFKFDAEMVSIKQAVALLATNEAQAAIEQAQVVSKVLAAFEKQTKPFELLEQTQDKIIETLQMLLAVMPSMANKASDAAKTKAGGDMPPEVADRLKKLKDALDKFIEAEKKVIKASKRLAKKPVDNFNAEDEKLLKDLILTQDKWEKFLNETFTDFSKLVNQDFSNPSIMKELLAVKSDVTMAKDALKKKATEIATAIEDNGVENAKSLTANLEKWLPDAPDRVKWAMEDPTDDMGAKIEQPELPTELEDLVGDLLEEEEDLFDDMDDLASKYAMSGDKGIGWDAMDGPISNMNAQGVTGNQLPNTNELQGRSGEGRTGKSSGEFVEDKAVGKGGRRTPTRLTPEPFQKGQVDDQSKEPPGGATGGGKFSGAGEEGLEGPVPPPMAEEMERMKGQQASLLNRSERLRENLRQDNYANFKLIQAITLMNRVHTDLANYRYQNVLRERKATLAALKETKLHIGRGIDVTVDTSSTMPKYVDDEIADAMKGNMPEEFREVLEQYYKRLSKHSGQ